MREWILIACVVAGCTGADEGQVSRAQLCEKMRDHLVELRLEGARKLPAIDLEQHRRALVASLGPGFVTTCADRTTDEKLSCLLAADSQQAASACESRGAR